MLREIDKNILGEKFSAPNKQQFIFTDGQNGPELQEVQLKNDRLRPHISPLGLKGYFNPAVVTNSDGSVTLIARHVIKAAEYGQPDSGTLEEIKLRHDGDSYRILEKKTIWKPEESPDKLLEDVRAYQDPSGVDKRVMLGATVVMFGKGVDENGQEKNEPVPFGAIAILDKETQLPQAPGLFRTCLELGPGKNMTPIDANGNFLFRKDGKDNHFKLTLCHFDQRANQITETGELNFQELMKGVSWGSWRIGTTSTIIAEGNFLTLQIHGIRTDKVSLTQNPSGIFFNYSLGMACLERMPDGRLKIISVDPEPMTIPDDFSQNGLRLGDQLHPELRDAIYLCGSVIRTSTNGEIYLDNFISYGDTETFLASFRLEDILKRSQYLRDQENKVASLIA